MTIINHHSSHGVFLFFRSYFLSVHDIKMIYHDMAFLILHPILAPGRCTCILVFVQPSGSWADIHGPNMGCSIKNAM